jgi:hypothetical protein
MIALFDPAQSRPRGKSALGYHLRRKPPTATCIMDVLTELSKRPADSDRGVMRCRHWKYRFPLYGLYVTRSFQKSSFRIGSSASGDKGHPQVPRIFAESMQFHFRNETSTVERPTGFDPGK